MNDFKSASTPDLLEQLKSGDFQKIIGAASELASRQEVSAVPLILEVLRTTNDASVRNATALAISDLKHPSGFDVLVALLKDERTRANRGTLLYAIDAYDCSPILQLLVDFVIDGNFEVSRQALSLISGIETEIDEQTWHSCIDRLRSALAAASEERRPILVELLSLFEQDP